MFSSEGCIWPNKNIEGECSIAPSPPPPPPMLHIYTGTMCNHLLHTVGADGIIISPSADYTTFENNASTFTFNCSGNGTFLYWTMDGHDSGTSYVLNKGIYPTPYVSPDGLTISSQLIVPTTKANNNTVVVCTVLDTSTYYRQSSDPVRLILQGTVHPI